MLKAVTNSNNSSAEAGLSTVEVIIVIIIAALYAISIFQLITSTNVLADNTSNKVTAGNIAYNNLRKYANGKSAIGWFDCTIASNAKPSTAYVPVAGQVLLNTTSSSSINGLPTPIVQKVVAIAPYGCSYGTNDLGTPLLIRSTIEYGTGGAKGTLTHATYISY